MTSTDVIPFLSLAALAPLLQTAGDGVAEEHAFLELEAPRASVYVHERVRVRVRFGFESAFLRDNMVQMFPRRLDVPAQVTASWLDDLPGTVIAGERMSFVLGESSAEAVRVADRVVGERSFTVLELERSYLPDTPGERVIPGAVLHFAYATRFEEDFLNGRVALDRTDASVASAPLVLIVLPLPEEGRPLDFHGAVGRFTVRCVASRTDVAEGESFELELHVEGEGNLRQFEAPRAPDLDGFQVYGAIEAPDEGHRVFRWDVAPLSTAVREIPAISFSFFDPEPPSGYRTVSTEPIPLRVHASAASRAPAARPETTRTVPSRPAARAKAQRWDLVWSKLLYFGLPVLAMLLLFRLPAQLRARARRRNDPTLSRARLAAAVFREHIADPGSDIARALAEFLAARLRCSTAALIGSDVAHRLIDAGVPAPLAGRAAHALDAHVAARYGGESPRDGEHGVAALVEELEEAFRSAETR